MKDSIRGNEQMLVSGGRSGMSTKERLHNLIDELPERELHAAERFLEYLRDAGYDPFLRAVAKAPQDDELETPEEAEAVREAKDEIAARQVLPHDEVRRRLLG